MAAIFPAPDHDHSRCSAEAIAHAEAICAERAERLNRPAPPSSCNTCGEPQAARRLRDHRSNRAEEDPPSAHHRLPGARVPDEAWIGSSDREPQCLSSVHS